MSERFTRRRFLELLAAAGVTASCDPTGVAESGTETREGPEPVETPSHEYSTADDEASPPESDDSDGASHSPARRGLDGSMLERSIPGTDESIPVVGLGTWQQFDVSSNSDRLPQLEKVLRTLIELEGTVVDTSPMYGRAERTLGSLIDEMGNRDELFLATKVWTRGEQSGIEQMKSSMQKLGVEQVDLMQVHNLLDWETHLETLRGWKKDGRVRHVGITHYTSSSLSRLADILESESFIDVVQFAYSIESRGAEERLLRVADEQDVATLINRPFEGGRLFARTKQRELPDWADEFDCNTWAQYFLKYLLGDDRVTCVIPGTSDPEHAADNLKAGYGALPDETQRQRMVSYWNQ